jgi:hypothetical protein
MTKSELESFFENLKEPVQRYKENFDKRIATGFNVFYLISDYYYRETFHGDLIAALLAPNEKHNEGNLYINLFIDMINEQKQLVDCQYYQTPIVIKEFSTNDGELSGRIDILIEGDKHCIVIENKLNNAPDTYQQLPKYYRDLNHRGFTIDAFVYLPLDPNKQPDYSSWTNNDVRKFISKRLVIIPAYSINSVNLVENWLAIAEEKTSNDDARFIIRQYKSLLNNLTVDIMDDREILDIISNERFFETTISILNLQNEFSNRIKRDFINCLEDKFKNLSGYIFYFDKNRVEIRNTSYPSWCFTIERYRNNQWWRGLYYLGTKPIAEDEVCKIKAWSNHPELTEYPLGWEYYEGNKSYWDMPQTLVIMRNGTFADEIISEVQEAFLEIEKQKLPK